MRVLLDTNVLIAAVITPGACQELFDYCILNHAITSSEYIVKEFTDKLIGKFGYSKAESNAALLIVFERIEITIPQTVFVKNLKDAKDLPVLGTALSGKCEVIITGDKQLQKLKYFKDIPIITPHQFWSFEVEKSARRL